MGWKEWLLGRKQVAGPLTQEQAIDILKRCGFWEPLPGTKAAANPKLFFPHFAAIAFAVDVDRALAFLRDPRVPPIVHVINTQADVEVYSDAGACAEAVQEGYCSPSVAAHKWLVVPCPPMVGNQRAA
jgi:hypothetical protein